MTLPVRWPSWVSRDARGWAFTVTRATLGTLYVLIASQVPVSILTEARHDDALFWTRAMHIVDGHWLGPYNELTLAKGPAYSVFLAANHLMGTSVLVSMALLYVLACWLVTHELERQGLRRLWGLTLFTGVLFHPAIIPTRVIRDDIYAALTMIALAGALRVYRPGPFSAGSWVLVLVGGGALGSMWATREEGVWVVPGLLSLGILAVFAARHRGSLPALLMRTGAFVAAAGLVLGGIMMANHKAYGRPVVTDFTDRPYADAVTALTSIDTGEPVPQVPVTEPMRRQAYRVSPAFRDLRRTLEAPENAWRGIGCPNGCADFAGGWWIWALREAVAREGYYRDATTAANFYQRVADEIGGACASGRLRCRDSGVPFMPHLTESQWRQLPGRLVQAAKLLSVTQGTVLGVGASGQPLDTLEDVRAFLGHPTSTLAVTEGRVVVTGWFHDPGGSWMRLKCQSPGRGWQSVEFDRLSSPDVAAVIGPSAARSRFAIDLDVGSRCKIATSPDNGEPGGIGLADVLAGGAGGYTLGTATLQVESATAASTAEPPTWARNLVNRLAVVYGWMMPVVLVLGLVGTVWGMVRFLRGDRARADLVVVAIVVWSLVATRSLVLALVDITSFYAMHAGYMSAGFPLALIASVAGLGSLAREQRTAADTAGGPRDVPE